MPTYRLTTPDSVEVLEADSCHVEGVHTVLRGTAYVTGRPREGSCGGCRGPSGSKADLAEVEDAPGHATTARVRPARVV